jgi:hypothetical protein
MLITLLVHYRIVVLHRMKNASDALFMRKLMLTVESTVSVCEQAIQVTWRFTRFTFLHHLQR